MGKSVHVQSRDPRATMAVSRFPDDEYHYVEVQNDSIPGYEAFAGQKSDLLMLRRADGQPMYEEVNKDDAASMKQDGRTCVVRCLKADFNAMQAAWTEHGQRGIALRKDTTSDGDVTDTQEFRTSAKPVKLGDMTAKGREKEPATP